MPLRVGIDISAIPYGRGVSRYTSNLVRALVKEKEVAVRMMGYSFRQQHQLRDFSFQTCPGCVKKILPHPAKVMNILWNDLHKVSPEFFLGDIQVFHSWDFQPPLHKAALVSTIHDLAMLRYPKIADPYMFSVHKKSWNHLKKEAKAIIAISQATKNDIVELLGIAAEKVFVVHEALPEEAMVEVDDAQKEVVLNKFNLTSKPLFFFLGTFEPRKNLPRLVEAWRKLSKDFELVLAGGVGWEEIKPEPGLHLLGPITSFEAAALYKSSSAFMYPSLYEGFGLPILEAFFHSTPVVTSKISSMPEVGGNAAVYVDPFEVESIRSGMEKAVQKRQELIELGKNQLKLFSWEKAAKETIEVYKKAVL